MRRAARHLAAFERRVRRVNGWAGKLRFHLGDEEWRWREPAVEGPGTGKKAGESADHGVLGLDDFSFKFNISGLGGGAPTKS